MKKNTQANVQLDTAHYTPEILEMMETTTKCLCCGFELKYNKNKEKRRNRGYCSLACYYKKPPKFAYIELVYKKPINEVILELLNLNNNVQATSDLLGISKPIMYRFLHQNNIERIVVWKGIVKDEKTYEGDTIDYELIKERCSQELSPFKHRRLK